MTLHSSRARRGKVDALAVDVGRLRRRVEEGSSLAHLADRLADEIEQLDAMLEPSAAQLRRELLAEAAGDDDAATEAALAIADARGRQLQALLGRTGGSR